MKHTFRFFSETHDDHQLYLTAGECQHLRVIRAKIGQVVEVGDGHGNVFNCRLRTLASNQACCEIIDRSFIPQPTIALTTVIGVQLTDRFEQVLRSVTELGSDSIVVFRHNNDGKFKLQLKYQQRWQKIIVGAVKQSKRAWLPRLTIAQNWQELLTIVAEKDWRLLLDINGQHSFDHLWQIEPQQPTTICLVSGSSCGFSDDELADLQNLGTIAINLGNNILRTETATILATGLVNFYRQLTVKGRSAR